MNRPQPGRSHSYGTKMSSACVHDQLWVQTRDIQPKLHFLRPAPLSRIRKEVCLYEVYIKGKLYLKI
jgi:hypothetical protein